MARLVRLEATGPTIIEIGGEKKAICACGLSKKRPYCDGGHAQTRSEEPGKVYRYESDSRQEVK